MSKAQSGSLKLIGLRAPAEGAVPSGFHSSVPARRMDSVPSAPSVPLITVKFDAPANAGEALKTRTMMRAVLCIGREHIPAPDSRKRKSELLYAALSSA